MQFNFTKKLADYIWIDGEFVNWEDAYIHVLTHSLHYAGAVFEGIRAYNGKIFKLVEHIIRLNNSAKTMHLSLNFTQEEICAATYDLLKKNNIKDAYIRPLVWRNSDNIAIYPQNCNSHLLIMANESKVEFSNDLKLILSPWRKISDMAMDPQSKSSAQYATSVISKKIAHDQSYDDALLLDPYGDIAESTTSNIFFAKGDHIVTPIADRFLNGITRQTVIELARSMGYKLKEKRIELSEIGQYDCCFLTGTAIEVKGVEIINIDGKKYFFNNKEIAIKLQNAYAELVGKNV